MRSKARPCLISSRSGLHFSKVQTNLIILSADLKVLVNRISLNCPDDVKAVASDLLRLFLIKMRRKPQDMS